MHHALITVLLQTPAGPAEEDSAAGSVPAMFVGQLPLAGRAIAARQIDLAVAAGCDTIAVLAPAGYPGMAALEARAAAGGARLHAIANAHGLAPLVSASDTLFVLDDGAVPIAAGALVELGEHTAILALPADPAADAGFERIDRDRAWAGAMRIPGRLVERLQRHSPDADPASMLLRLALQAGVPMIDVPPEDWLAAWDDAGVREAERDWLARRIPPAEPFAPTDQLAAFLFRQRGAVLLPCLARAAGWSDAAIAVLAVGGVALAGTGVSAALGLFAIALAFAAFVVVAMARAIEAPARPVRGARTLAWGLDLAFVLALVAGTGGFADTTPDTAFAALVLLVALRLLLPPRRSRGAQLARDRAVLALVLAGAYAIGIGPVAVQVIALAALIAAGR